MKSVKITGSNEGFSLIEILVVVAILGILSTIVVRRMTGQTDKERITASGYARQESLTPPPIKESTEKPTTQLKAEVDKLLACGDNVMLRRNVADVFALVDRLVEAKQNDEALRYLSHAIKHNSWALDYQLLNARLLQAKGDTNVPRQTATLVMEYAEQDKQINSARQLVKQDPLQKLAQLKEITGDSVTVVLIPVGEVDVCVLADMRTRLAEGLGISVLMADAGVSVPGFKRDPVELGMSELRERLLIAMEKDVQTRNFLKQNGITAESLKQEKVLVDAYRRLIFVFGGTNALDRLDTQMAQLAKSEKQWDVGDIVNNLADAVKPFLRKNLYFLGVTDLDIFANKSNFMFYWSEYPGSHSVTSYRRFTADFQEDTPNRKRLVERSMKASLACIGFMLGVPRCSDPTCPRAYPHSLRELDASSLELCDSCRKGFQGVPGVMPSTNEKGQSPPRN